MLVKTIVIAALGLGRPALSNLNAAGVSVTPLGAVALKAVPVTGLMIGDAQPAAVPALTLLAVTHTNTSRRHAIAIFWESRTTDFALSKNPRDWKLLLPVNRGIATSATIPAIVITTTSSITVNPFVVLRRCNSIPDILNRRTENKTGEASSADGSYTRSEPHPTQGRCERPLES